MIAILVVTISLTVTNKSPGAELTVGVRAPMHVRDLNGTPGCKFTARNTLQEAFSCPKVTEYRPVEHEITVIGPDGAVCRLGITNRENGWDTRISGPCEMTQLGQSSLTITPRS